MKNGLSKNQVASELMNIKLKVKDLISDLSYYPEDYTKELFDHLECVKRELEDISFEVKLGNYDKSKIRLVN